MILFCDTETTGFPRPKLPLDHEDQPYIVQLAAQLCEDDGEVVAGFSLIIDPGREIPEKAAAIHGITTEKAVAIGMNAEVVMASFVHLYQRADVMVAHNIKFDQFVLEAQIARYYSKPVPLKKKQFCTMEAAKPVLALPASERMLAAGFPSPKPPRLSECIKRFFDEELDGAHDAMVDLLTCKRVYFHLQSLEKAA